MPISVINLFIKTKKYGSFTLKGEATVCALCVLNLYVLACQDYPVVSRDEEENEPGGMPDVENNTTDKEENYSPQVYRLKQQHFLF